MGWKKEPELKKITSIQDGLQKLIEAEVEKTKQTLERFIKVVETKAKHDMDKKANTSTTD